VQVALVAVLVARLDRSCRSDWKSRSFRQIIVLLQWNRVVHG